MSTSQKGRCPGQSNNIGTLRTGAKDTVARSETRAPARTYAISAREEATALNVIASTFYLFDVTIYALIDPGSTYSYIFTTLVTGKKLPIKSTEYDIQVTNPLGQSVIVNLVCRKCPLKIKGCEFLIDLMLLPFWEYDVILGMDWLSLHDAVVNSRQKQIDLKCLTREVISVEADRPISIARIISTIPAHRLIVNVMRHF
ncbi:uncharacterized protein LOC108481562 [Gossypium arboreum]|uniref:uncharacterized protein LOC108481562 n=1 Tax=Gossypium arboreum TaxID=29729 RepID=UPI00081923E9|nr:uncharacterized protein LOC108481562 [Gossypium arboreum]